jgi:CpeT protein
VRAVAVALLGLGCAGPVVEPEALAQPAAAPGPSAELQRFLAWFPGEYSNHEQVVEHDAVEGAEPMHRLHHLFLPVPAFHLDGHAFFVRQTLDGGDAPFRVRLYAISEPSPGEIRLDIFKFADEPAWRDAHLRPADFATLTMNQLEPTPGCEVTWRWDGARFEGAVREGACRIVSSRSGEPLTIHDELTLTDEVITIHDVGYREDGSVAFGDPERPGVNRKLRHYEGWAVVRPGGPDHDRDDPPDWMAHRDLTLHSEGSEVSLVDGDGAPMGYRVELARLTRSGSDTHLLKLTLVDEATDKAAAYAWGDPHAHRLGVNLGWAQVGLTASEHTPHLGFDDARPDDVVQALAEALEGRFDSSGQARADEHYRDVTLTTCRADAPALGPQVLYVEQAISDSLDAPYRQRVYVLEPDDADTVVSRVYTLQDPASAVGACAQDAPLALDVEAVVERAGCAVHLRWQHGAFVGSTLGEACTSGLRGARYATSRVVVEPERLLSWDQGWAAPGEQAWGATAGPYHFERVAPPSEG